MGSGLPMFLEVKHEIDGVSPAIYLRRVKVTLDTLGTVRGLKSRYLALRDDCRVEPFERPIVIGECDGMGYPPPITKPLDLRELLNLHLDPRFLSPVFSTFNIEVRHTLTIKVVVECARKTFKAKWLQSDFLILPEVYQAPSVPGGSLLPGNELLVLGQNHATPSAEGITPPPRYEGTPVDTQ